MQLIKVCNWVVFLSSSLLFSSCSYFMVSPVEIERPESFYTSVEDTNQYVILHFQDSVLHFKDISVSESEQVLTGILEPVSKLHTAYTRKKRDRRNQYNQYGMVIENEIHVYVSKSDPQDYGAYSIKLIEINRIERFVVDKKAQSSAIIVSCLART